jgi:hypothetical protein
MNPMFSVFECVVSFKKGSSPVGVRAVVESSDVPVEVQELMRQRKNKKK